MKQMRLTSYFFQVHNILAEMVMGGMVLETNMNEIITQVDAQNKMEKSEVSPTLPVHCMYDVYVDPASHTLGGIVYSMQACVYAAPCMLLSGDHVDAPYRLFSVCALFFGLSSRCCTALNTGRDSTCPLVYEIQHHHFCHYYWDLAAPLSSASPESVTIESLNHHLVELTWYIHENRLVVL